MSNNNNRPEAKNHTLRNNKKNPFLNPFLDPKNSFNDEIRESKKHPCSGDFGFIIGEIFGSLTSLNKRYKNLYYLSLIVLLILIYLHFKSKNKES